LYAGDSLQASFTLAYPTQNLPFCPQEITLEIATNVGNFKAEASGKVYFTPCNTIEFFNQHIQPLCSNRHFPAGFSKEAFTKKMILRFFNKYFQL